MRLVAGAAMNPKARGERWGEERFEGDVARVVTPLYSQ